VLSLNSDRWAELRHAYGSAKNIPALLRQLRTLPTSVGKSEPWYTLWSSLAHQGDVYSASFAAVPHVIHVVASAPLKVDSTYFHFPAWVEICRMKRQMSVPKDLHDSYFESLALVPALLAAASHRQWEPDFLVCALAAMSAAKGQSIIAEAVLEFSEPGAAEKFVNGAFNQ
jgi:hypothetical protein